MRSILNPTSLYVSDGGRIMCGSVRCAGVTVSTTGRDLSGQRVDVLTSPDARFLQREYGFLPTCETCGASFRFVQEVQS